MKAQELNQKLNKISQGKLNRVYVEPTGLAGIQLKDWFFGGNDDNGNECWVRISKTLSARKTEVYTLKYKGYTLKEIAEKLTVSIYTVNNYITEINNIKGRFDLLVDKSKFEVYEFIGGYYSIRGKIGGVTIDVWGGDSAWEDCYDKELAEEVYKNWDGRLNHDIHIEL